MMPDPDTPFDEEESEIENDCRRALEAFEDGDIERAREIADEARAQDTEHPFPLFVLGVIAEYENDLIMARHLSDLALEHASTNPDAISLRVQVHLREHELEKAEELLRFGIAHNPEDATLHEALARISLASGNYDEAVAAATASLRLESDNPGAMAVRTAALDEMGDRDAVIAALRQTVQMHPDDPWSMVELAAMETEAGNVDRASVLLTRAHRLMPRDSNINEDRAMIDGARSGFLLRPMPTLMRWVRDFPGGLTGFMFSFLLAALPMHALIQAQPQYALPALVLMGIWAATATYAWLGPALLTRRLNSLAATTSLKRLGDPSQVDGEFDITALSETIALLAASYRYRTGAAVLLRWSSLIEPAEAAEELAGLARWMKSPLRGAQRMFISVPAIGRVLVLVSCGFFIGAQPLAAAFGVRPLQMYAASVAMLMLAGAARWIETRVMDRVHESFGAAITIAAGIDEDSAAAA